MHLEGAGLAEHPDLGALGVAAHDRVVDDDEPLAADHVLERVELEPDAELAQRLAGLDEGAADVGVLDEALAEGDAALLGVPGGGRGAGLGDRHHQVGLDRELAGQLRGPSRRGPRGRCGRRWWRRGGRGRRTRTRSPCGAGSANRWVRRPFSSMTISSPGSTSRTTLAPIVARAASSRGDHPAAVEPAEHQRADALRVAGGVQRVLVHPDEREGARAACGSTSSARCSSEVSGWWASSAVTSPVSLVDVSTVAGVQVELALRVRAGPRPSAAARGC